MALRPSRLNPVGRPALRTVRTDENRLLTVVVPVLDDAEALASLLPDLRRLLGLPHPNRAIVVVDGGSRESPAGLLEAGESLLTSAPGRGQQLATGTSEIQQGWIWMLHADSGLSAAVIEDLERMMAGEPNWGRFDVSIEGLHVVSAFMNRRSAITGICTGDQGIAVHSSLLRMIGGVPQQSLMEDIELSRRLKRLRSPVRLRARIATSARRWRREGVMRCIVQMWRYRLRYFFGADPEELARDYYGSSAEQTR